MQDLLQKLKTNSFLTLILGLLALTWLIIDYFVLETILIEGLSKFSLEWILLLVSAVAFLIFIVSVFITIFYSFRVIRKAKKELGKMREQDQSNLEKQNEKESGRYNAES